MTVVETIQELHLTHGNDAEIDFSDYKNLRRLEVKQAKKIDWDLSPLVALDTLRIPSINDGLSSMSQYR